MHECMGRMGLQEFLYADEGRSVVVKKRVGAVSQMMVDNSNGKIQLHGLATRQCG